MYSMTTFPILSTLIWQPLIFAAILFFKPRLSERSGYRLAILSTIITICFNIMLVYHFDSAMVNYQFIEFKSWLPPLNSHYHLGIDGLALALISLTTFMTAIVIATSKQLVEHKLTAYNIIFLLLQAFMNGLFSSQDALLFFVFFEAILIPMYLCIGIWGSHNRSYAAIKFFLYTFIGSIFLFIAVIYLGINAHSFAIYDLIKLPMTLQEQTIIMVMFWLAFAVKIPMFPLHTWLPDAHTEAPAGGSVILAALLLKVGAFGIYRFILPITPDAVLAHANIIIILSLISITYIGMVALAQNDIKRLIAYSSVAHMGFVTLGCVLIYPISLQYHHNAELMHMAMQGSMMQMIAHGFSSGALFLSFGYIYHHLKERDIAQYGGISQVAPYLSACFMVFCLSNVGLPGTAGFVGEFMVIISSAQASPIITVFAATTLILSASYTLWMYRRVFYGNPSDLVINLKDINGYFLYILLGLAGLIIMAGCYPSLILDYLSLSSKTVIDQGLLSKTPLLL